MHKIFSGCTHHYIYTWRCSCKPWIIYWWSVAWYMLIKCTLNDRTFCSWLTCRVCSIQRIPSSFRCFEVCLELAWYSTGKLEGLVIKKYYFLAFICLWNFTFLDEILRHSWCVCAYMYLFKLQEYPLQNPVKAVKWYFGCQQVFVIRNQSTFCKVYE